MNNEGYNYAKKSKNLVTNIARITPVRNAACKLLIFSIRDHLFFISFKRNACSLHIMISEQSFVYGISLTLFYYVLVKRIKQEITNVGIQMNVISYGYISFAM